jgi:GNAT superfamily N-acetyltransferase
MTRPRIDAEPAYRLRPATLEDIGFLADVVVEATRAQGRLSDAFDETTWRRNFTAWTRKQILGAVPESRTSVIEFGGERVGRLRVTRSGDRIDLSGIQLLPRAQGRGIGTAIIEELKAEAEAGGACLDIPRARRLYERLGCVQVAEDEQEHKLRWCPSAPSLGAREFGARNTRALLMGVEVRAKAAPAARPGDDLDRPAHAVAAEQEP